MSDLVKETLGKFIDLAQEEKQIAADIDAAYKEYTDYCEDSEKDLNKKIDEIHEKMDKLNYYLDYAREHANSADLEEAPEAFDTPDGTLESVRQTIKLDSRHDPNAETLYTKATGKQKYYQEKIEQTRKLIEGSKVQAKRQYDSEAARLNKAKEEHYNKVREYVQSDDFSEYIKVLVYDKSAFNSPGTVTLADNEHISLGQRRVKLTLPMDIEQDIALSSNGEYNAAARTIGAPYQISVKKGSVLFLEHDERNAQYLLGGVQRLLLNFIKYFGEEIASVIFCEPEHFNVETLGNISTLGKGINPFITVPKSAEEISMRVSKLSDKLASAPSSDKVTRILVMQNFPEKYSPEVAAKVLEMSKNAEKSGLLLILTHTIPMDVTPVEKEIRELAEVVRSRNGGFWIEKTHESLFWYSAPSDLSDEVRRVYVDKRRKDAVMAAQETPKPEPAEKPEPVDTPKPAEEPKPVPPVQAENKAPADKEAANPASHEDEGLKSLSVDENGNPIPAHILFSVTRPKEEKEVTMTVMSEISDQLPPPPVEEPETKEETESGVKINAPTPSDIFAPDFRPEQKLDPELTYRITDHPPVKREETEEEPEKPRTSIKDVFDAGKRKLGAFVDNINKRSESDEAESAPAEAEASDGAVKLEERDTPASVKIPEPEPTPEPEPAPEPVPFVKGRRILPDVPIGKTVDGVPAALNINGNITYICGNRGEERKKLTERVISQIIADTHPDDTELWLFDCGDGEFMKYADDHDPHIKFLISDAGAEMSLDFADAISNETERRADLFAENGWTDTDDIPDDVYMPLIVVAVNAFPRFAENIAGTNKYFGRNYSYKLARLFKSGFNYGVHFLLIGDDFTVDGERPACLEGVMIHSAAVAAGKEHFAHKLFSGIKLYDNEIESLLKIPRGCVFTADENSTEGLTLVRITGANAENTHEYTVTNEYSTDVAVFLEKHPFIGDRKTSRRFDDRREFRAEQIALRQKDECVLFLGEPCRLMDEYPVKLYDDFGENLLAIAPAREKHSAAAMVTAAIRSLEEQGIKAEILTSRGNPVFDELSGNGVLKNIKVYESAGSELRIKELSEQLEKGERQNVFEIVLGGDLLVASMHADDLISVLKCALVKGPRLGTHFMFVSGSAGTAATGFLSLFRHKMVFACPFNEAEKILRDPQCDLPENGFRLSNDYDELTILPYSM